MHSRRNGVNPFSRHHRRRSPLRLRRGLCCSQRAGESRGDPKGRIADGVRRVAGLFLVQAWYGPGARQGTDLRRGSLHPPRRQGACRPLHPRLPAQPAHRPTLRAPCGTRVDCLRSRLPPRCFSLRVVVDPPHRSSRWKATLPAPFRHVQDPALRDSVAPSSGYARQGPPGTSRKLSAARKLSRKSRSFPLDPRCRGGARKASRAKARRARRKSGAYARAAFAR